MSEANNTLVSELFTDLRDLINEKTQSDIGDEVVMAVVRRFGGLNLYIPREERYKRAQRDEQIYLKFNGMNIKHLALQYNLSEQSIRNIVERAAPQQSDLFG